MQIIYTSLKTDNHASTYRPDALPAEPATNQQRQNIETTVKY